MNDHVSDTGSGEPLVLFIIILPVLFKTVNLTDSLLLWKTLCSIFC